MTTAVRRSLLSCLTFISIGTLLSCGGTSKPPQPPDVFVTGFEANGAGLDVAKYWKNGARVTLGTGTFGSAGYSIFVSGSDVYVSGTEGSPNGDVAKYWKNGVGVNLTNGAQGLAAIATSIVIDGNNVYVAGFDQGVAEYWKNGVPVVLTDGTQHAEAWSIAVSGSDIYVAGWENKTTQIDPNHFVNNPVAKYWKNGAPTELTD